MSTKKAEKKKTRSTKSKSKKTTSKKTTTRKRKNLTKKEIEKLTPKQQKFIEEYINNGGNGTRAALVAYNTESENTANVIASENLRKPMISSVVERYSDRFDPELIYEKHMALLNKKEVIVKNNMTSGEIDVIDTGQIDTQAVKSGLDMFYKLSGSYAPEKKINVNIYEEKRKQSTEAIRKYLNERN